MLKTRTLTAVIGIPVILGILYAGGIYGDIFFGLLGMLGMYELFAMMSRAAYHPLYLPGYVLMITLLYGSKYPQHLPLIISVLMLFMIIYAVLTYPRIQILDVSLSLMAAVYLGWTLSYAEKILTLSDPFPVMLLVFLLTWASDVGGYVCGRLWGKHKLAPLLSPKKTWQGAVGATVLPIVTAGIYFYFWPSSLSLASYLLLGLTAGVLAQCGDLFMSSIKRFFQIKDSGYIIPGHGGVLDRFDSFLLVAPVVYYFFVNIL